MVLEGRCYTASPYGDSLQDVLWHWVCESSDGSVMRYVTEPEDKWNSFAETLKRNLCEWVEYFKLKYGSDRPTDASSRGWPDSNARLSNVDGEVKSEELVEDSSKNKVDVDSKSNNPLLSGIKPPSSNANSVSQDDEIQSINNPEDPEIPSGMETGMLHETSSLNTQAGSLTQRSDVIAAEAIETHHGTLTLANMPRLNKCDKGSKWILSTSHEMQNDFGWAERSLQKQREEGIKSSQLNPYRDPMYGISSKGCPWERDATNRNEVWHFKALIVVNNRRKNSK